mgnify:CR=1 FL=1
MDSVSIDSVSIDSVTHSLISLVSLSSFNINSNININPNSEKMEINEKCTPNK